MQTNVFILHHHPAGLEAIADIEALAEIVGRRFEARAQISLLPVGREGDAVHRADVDAGIAFDAGLASKDRLDVAIQAALGFDPQLALAESERCLNCDVQTVFTSSLCIECDACVDICPMDCITFTGNDEETELRQRLQAPAKNLGQDLYIGNSLKTGRIMVKDEDVCLHCGLCAERCPTGAWDMQKYLIDMTHAEQACQSRA